MNSFITAGPRQSCNSKCPTEESVQNTQLVGGDEQQSMEQTHSAVVLAINWVLIETEIQLIAFWL